MNDMVSKVGLGIGLILLSSVVGLAANKAAGSRANVAGAALPVAPPAAPSLASWSGARVTASIVAAAQLAPPPPPPIRAYGIAAARNRATGPALAARYLAVARAKNAYAT